MNKTISISPKSLFRSMLAGMLFITSSLSAQYSHTYTVNGKDTTWQVDMHSNPDIFQNNDIINYPPLTRFNIHCQATYVYQYKPAFNVLYSGQNSLGHEEERVNSITSTLNVGMRLWKGAEVYINPEVAGGSGLSGAFGLAASTNGETFRVGDPSPTLYLARGFLKQTFALGQEVTKIYDQANQLTTNEPKNYLRFLVGKISLGDLFDINNYAGSPRTQFMNWCLMSNGAWDYAANLRGYTYAFATVLKQGDMAYKAALATLPVTANGIDLNTNLAQEYSINAQVERAYKINKQPGNLRVLGYYNNGHMGNYELALKSFGWMPPDVTKNRAYGRTKPGFGINADQQINDQVGVFARLGWNDGQNETWCFTEADEALSAGIQISGNNWHRKNDVLAIATVVNGLSDNHKNYLMRGGSGFQLGDGSLNYGYETAAEIYYSYKPDKLRNIWLTADYQFILNPGYNKDRGPVNAFSVRMHIEL